MQAFTEVICGWNWDEDRQSNSKCLMGEILCMYLKYENGTRGGLHAHGQLTQPVLQTENVRRMLKDGVYQQAVCEFLESFMCCYFPSPNLSAIDQDSRVRNNEDWLLEKCPLIEG